jgi:Ser/Thr protein kinase RdoA (MazF antagonist)
VHGLDADPQPKASPLSSGHIPGNFPSFARSLQLRLAELPMRTDRVRAHLDQMTDYVVGHGDQFAIPSRLIHGDLDRKNIVVAGPSIGILDWADLGAGDYAFDLGMLKFMLDSVWAARGATLIREQARRYRERFQDSSLELRLRFFLALAGLIHAFQATDDTGSFTPARAWRVRTSYLHSETQWTTPLQLDGNAAGAPAVRTEQSALDIRQPLRGLFYLLAPKRVA